MAWVIGIVLLFGVIGFIYFFGPFILAAFIIFGLLWAIGRWLDQMSFDRQQERKRKLQEARERPQREWERQYDVYVESEMLKGATREEAQATARSFLGDSPDEIAEAKRHEQEELRRLQKEESERRRQEKRELQEAARYLEEERLRKAEEARHNKEVLQERAKLDSERLEREAREREEELQRQELVSGEACEKSAERVERTAEAREQLAAQANAPVEPERDVVAEATEAFLELVPGRFRSLVDLLLSKKDGRVEYATDDAWVRFVVGAKPYAVLHFDREGEPTTGGNLLTVRVNPDLSDYLQSQHTGIVSGNHTDDGDSWVIVNLDGDLPEKLLQTLCNMSYEAACR